MKAIYTILNKINGKQYIGSATSFYRRRHQHLRNLRSGNHHSIYLQNAWNKYGEENFKFIILEKVNNKNDLILREQYYFDNIKPEYNICKVAGSRLGQKHTEETKLLLKNNNWKGILDVNNPFSKKCYQYDLDGNFIKEWNAVMQVSREIGLSDSIIVRCLKGKTRTAHKFQWFYEYKGEKIDPIKVKSHINGVKNKTFFNELKSYLEKGLSLKEIAENTNSKLSRITGAYYRYRNKF